MWSALTVVAALSLAPGQAGQLKLSNDRPTYGTLGATRADSKVFPGDFFTVSYDIENLQADAMGKIRYSMAMEVLDKAGRPLFRKGGEPRDVEGINSLGGTRVPAWAFTEIGTDMAPGEYTMKVTVTDRASKKSQTISRKFEVQPKGFGLVRARMLYLGEGHVPAPPVGVVGQQYIVSCGACGFERDKLKKQPNLQFELRVLDESGKAIHAKPDVILVDQDVPAHYSAVEVPFIVSLSRPGSFRLELKATDRITNRTTAVTTLPLTVVELKH